MRECEQKPANQAEVGVGDVHNVLRTVTPVLSCKFSVILKNYDG